MIMFSCCRDEMVSVVAPCGRTYQVCAVCDCGINDCTEGYCSHHDCPWCGEDLHCSLVEYDDAISEHVLSDCVPWQIEQGHLPSDATTPIQVGDL